MKKWLAAAIGFSIPAAIVSCGASSGNPFLGSGGGGENPNAGSGGTLSSSESGATTNSAGIGGSLAVTNGSVGTSVSSASSATSGSAGGQGGASATNATSATTTTASSTSETVSSTATGPGGCGSATNVDSDGDGFTPAQGDCNDCDPNVNPGAIDVGPQPNGDGGMTMGSDNDCDTKITLNVTCDTGLALNDIAPLDGAKAIELCQQQSGSKWGVTTANYVRADGTTIAGTTQVGIQPSFGPNLAVQMGKNMLAISSGRARIPGQADACTTRGCTGTEDGTAPTGFPADVANCPPSQDIFDDIGLQVAIKSPTNATGYSFSFDFYSFEYPEWVCNDYNDQFIALVTPAPAGAINGNISFDQNHNPVSVNIAFFDVCDPTNSAAFALNCLSQNCPSPPSPYCPAGIGQLKSTGFDTLGLHKWAAGATSWLKTTAPIKGGETVTIRFAIWDTGDDDYDSTALVDDFQWIATPGKPVVVQTGHI